MLMITNTLCLQGRIRRLRSERGGSLVEYALLVALIALVAFAAVVSLGGTVSSQFVPIGSSLAN